MHAPEGATVSVTGGRGVGPVGSPAEQADVGTMHTIRSAKQMARRRVVVTVATGVVHGLSSPGRVPRFVMDVVKGLLSPGRVPRYVVDVVEGLLSPGRVPRKVVSGLGDARALK